jgi:citrate synthase
MRSAGRRTPGLGHPVHKDTDPRVPRMYALAGELELVGPHLRVLELVAEEQASSGRRLPINGAGVAGAALADLGFDWRIIRGFALLARTAGLLGHLAEEIEGSMAMPLWQAVEHAATEQKLR